MPKARRLDEAVAQRDGITRSQARSLIMEGRVTRRRRRRDESGAERCGRGARIEIERPRRFVSRGGEKLEHALEAFGIDVARPRRARRRRVDRRLHRLPACSAARRTSPRSTSATASSTGGCATIRACTSIERTNFRLAARRRVSGRLRPDRDRRVVHLAAHDRGARASATCARAASIVALVKPQFEAGRERVGPRRRRARPRDVHRDVLREVREAADARSASSPVALAASPLLGPAGNREFFWSCARSGTPIGDARIDAVLDEERAR